MHPHSITSTLLSTLLIAATLHIPHTSARDNPQFPSLPHTSTPTNTQNYREGEVIIKYKSAEKKEKALSAIATKAEGSQKFKLPQLFSDQKKESDIALKDEVDDLNIAVLTSNKKTTKELIDEFEKSDDIEYVEPNYIKTPTFTPNDPYFADQWAHYRNDDHDIDSTEAWDIEQNTATETIVAVIDSGIDHNFPELAPNMWDGGVLYPNHGWDFADNDNDPDDTPHSDPEFQGHGTHVASIFGAVTNDATGIAGISRYNTIKMMALRFDLDTITEVQAINFAKNNGAKVINASFAGAGYSQAEKDAIDAFPGIVVTASGNGGDDSIGDNNEITPQYPCNYASDNIICVGASDDTDNLTSFSNYGESVDIAAPGESILGIQQNAYYYGSGTSFATPFVTGTVALLYAHSPSASMSTIKNTLLKSSDHPQALRQKTSCARRLNVKTALNSIINSTIPNETCLNPVYRFYSQNNKAHFFTTSANEKDRIIATYPTTEWRYEGVAYYVPTTSSGNRPVYRFYSQNNKAHFFTINKGEKDRIIATYPTTEWRYEGVAYYVPTTSSGNRPVYRFYSQNNKAHFFTTSANEKDRIIATYPTTEWRYEGIAYYVPK
jgi:hypothetical protein